MTEQSVFTPAPDRTYIPRTGLYPDARYQLSVNPIVPLVLPDLPPVPFDQSAIELGRLWLSLLHQRQSESGLVDFSQEHYPGYPYDFLVPVAFAPTSEQLFKEVATLAIKKHGEKTGKTHLAVDEVSYLFPFWSRQQLQPVEIVEGNLQELVRQHQALPASVGAVYIDFPSTLGVYSQSDINRLIKNNPSVLFVIDQANLYFFASPYKSVGDDFMLKRPGQQRDNDLVLVMNTTTKAIGQAGCAALAATERAKGLLKERVPAAIGFDEASFLHARQLLTLETSPEIGAQNYDPEDNIAFAYRLATAQNRHALSAKLVEHFGENAISPELPFAGQHIFINAEELGFTSAQELCDTLYHRFSIATKPAAVYANIQKHPEYGKYVYMAVPRDNETLAAVIQAFDDLTT